MKACMQAHCSTSSNTKTAETEITDRERDGEMLREMDTIIAFVCHACFYILAELTSCPGCVIRQFLGLFLERRPSSSRTGPYG